ncbi:MAG: putative TetR family transcriptional regulator [Ilumatobacteraceae bacterium]|nr:putative TetR family transcriptional regulator [Ilumatobacteraceae bacterium]
MARSGEPARQALIEHAERLFAERGIEGVSLRDVSAAAGQRNHSAAQYHFGDRRGLVIAVYEARMRLVDERRRVRLVELDTDGRSADLGALVEAVVAPLVEIVAEADGWYGRFLARTRWDTMAWDVVAHLPEAHSILEAEHRIVALLHDLPDGVRRSRVDQLLTLVVGTIAGWEWSHHRGVPRLSQQDLTADLVSTAVALLGAPVPTSPLRGVHA